MVLFSSAAHFPLERKKDQSIFAAVIDKPIKQDYFYKMLVDKLSAVEKAKKPETVFVDPNKLTESGLSVLVAEDNEINQKL